MQAVRKPFMCKQSRQYVTEVVKRAAPRSEAVCWYSETLSPTIDILYQDLRYSQDLSTPYFSHASVSRGHAAPFHVLLVRLSIAFAAYR